MDNPGFDDFCERIRKELISKIQGSDICVSITPRGAPDAKFCVELGLAIMLNKPIVAVIQPGTQVPEKLTRVVDRFVEADLDNPDGLQHLATTINDVVAEMLRGDDHV